MATARSLAEGHAKLIICTTKPANVLQPTLIELAAGIDASHVILESDFAWGATDSDKVQEKALDAINNAQALGAGNYTNGITLFRLFDTTTKNPDATADAAFAALKVKGTTIWGYCRKTAKLSTDALASGDEIYHGGELITDTPQDLSAGGFIKFRVPMEMQNATNFITLS